MKSTNQADENHIDAENLLLILAGKYIWWKTPEVAAGFPQQVWAQTMNLGDFSDVMLMINTLGEPYLKNVLQHAKPGQFNERSWHYWHYRLGLCKLGQVPPLPVRRFL